MSRRGQERCRVPWRLGWLLASVPAVLAGGEEALAPARLQVALAPKAGVALEEGRLQLRSPGRAPIELSAAGTTTVFELPAGSSWELTAAIPGAWVSPQSVVAGAAGSVTGLSVPVWPLAWLEGTLRLPAGEKTYPRELLASIEPAPFAGTRAIRRGLSPCPVEEEGRFRCPLPAGATAPSILRPSRSRPPDRPPG